MIRTLVDTEIPINARDIPIQSVRRRRNCNRIGKVRERKSIFKTQFEKFKIPFSNPYGKLNIKPLLIKKRKNLKYQK